MIKFPKIITVWFLILTLLAGCCLLTFEVRAESDQDEEEDNPFLSRKQELSYEDEDERTIENMSLTAILYSGKKSRAMVDGRIVEIGDVIDNKEVIDITSEKVIFKDFLDKQYTLKMRGILSAANDDDDEGE